MSINQARKDLATDLRDATGVMVYDHLPESIIAPAYVVVPDSPFVDTEGEPFGSYRVRFTVIAVADVSTNETATNALDDLITTALGLIPVESVSEPYVYQSNTALHLAADIHYHTVISL